MNHKQLPISPGRLPDDGLAGGDHRLSSIPVRGDTEDGPLVQLVSNLSHVPLFAGLAFCCVKTMAKNGEVSSVAIGTAFLGATACAVLDEWRQSFVPGRHVSAGDLLLDLTGAAGMLFFLYRRRRRGSGVGADAAPETP